MRKIVALSFDDGVKQDVRLVELLNRRGLKATFNLNFACLGQPGRVVCEGVSLCQDKLRPEDVRSVYAGHEIAGHSLHHPLLTELGEEEIVREVEEDRLRLSELAGREVTGFAYPGGGFDARVMDVLSRRTGVRYARTVRSTGRFDLPGDPLALHPTAHWREAPALLDRWEAADGGFLLIWGHAYEMDLPGGWSLAEALFDRLADRPDIETLPTAAALAAFTDSRAN